MTIYILFRILFAVAIAAVILGGYRLVFRKAATKDDGRPPDWY